MSALTPYDRMVSELRAKGVPEEKAIAAARREFCMTIDSFTVEEQAIEDEHVREGVRMMQALGFTHRKLSQKRKAKEQTPGWPDHRFYHRGRRLKVWWEAKAEWGVQSPAQREFQRDCEATDDPYVLGGLEALKAWLRANDVADFENGQPEPIHQETANAVRH